MEKIRVTHIITGLSAGGAEIVLSRLVARMDRDGFSSRVISLTDLGFVAREIEDVAVQVSAIGFSTIPFQTPFPRLVKEIRQSKPHIVQTWMYHADLIGGILTHLFAGVPVIWNLRQSNFHPEDSKRTTILSAKLCAWLSNQLPHAIVCGSHAAYSSHIKLGYKPDRMVVLPNGFDTAVFRPEPRYRSALLEALGLDEDAFVVGMAARFHRQKDHATFFAAAGQVACRVPQARFVLCGEGVDEQNGDLRTLIEAHGLGGRIHLLGLRNGLASFYPALDVLVLSSAYGEGAPNVVGEAMSCAVPCVATDVGDSALMVGPTGIVVPPRNADALAGGLLRLANMPEIERRKLGEAARSRNVNEFPLDLGVDRYEELYRRVFSQRYPQRPATAGAFDAS
jgi:glycosyltransferase involved in cell wall biosynthesis